MTQQLQQTMMILKKNTATLRKEYGVRRFGVFGSVARGDETLSSDIDILAEFSEPIGLFKFVELEGRLKTLLHRNVDLVTKEALKSATRTDILRQTVYV